jgi:hypothetical protein
MHLWRKRQQGASGSHELTEDIRDSETRGVHVETNRKIRIEVTEDGSEGKMAFKFLKGFLSLGGPFKPLIFVKKRRDRGSDVGISLNKTMIEIHEA